MQTLSKWKSTLRLLRKTLSSSNAIVDVKNIVSLFIWKYELRITRLLVQFRHPLWKDHASLAFSTWGSFDPLVFKIWKRFSVNMVTIVMLSDLTIKMSSDCFSRYHFFVVFGWNFLVAEFFIAGFPSNKHEFHQRRILKRAMSKIRWKTLQICFYI